MLCPQTHEGQAALGGEVSRRAVDGGSRRADA
jgi:hypothetical protein